MLIAAGLVLALASFALSASAGLGGSLILVPAMSVVLGPKEGVALAALMLGANNIAKVVAYRRTIPLRASAAILVLTVLGSAVGAAALVAAPERLVAVVVVASFIVALVLERKRLRTIQRAYAPMMALGAGALSGFSGTSGPMKGAALRTLSLDRLHFVGAASIVSMVNDLTKTAIYSHASLITAEGLTIFLLSLPLMIAGTTLGRRVNRTIGERAFTGLFWSVMAGYGVRILAAV